MAVSSATPRASATKLPARPVARARAVCQASPIMAGCSLPRDRPSGWRSAAAWGRAVRRRPGRRRGTPRGRRRPAATGSWVTMMTVCPCPSTRPRSRPRTSWPLAESSMPVGSSANTTSGRVTSARAMATRCCWPPDSWEGRWPARSARPTAPSTRADLRPGGPAPGQPQRQRDVQLGGQRRQQVERLEHEPDAVPPQQGQLGLAELAELAARPARPRPRWAGPAPPRTAAACSCPSRTGP